MREIEGRLDASGKRFAIVASRFNEMVTDRLVRGAAACLRQHGAGSDAVDCVRVPGAWELPPVVRRAAESGRYDAVIALGCVIRGETPHFDYVAGTASSGLARLALDGPVPVAFGLLTTDTPDQAMARAGGKSGNKGWESALAALEMVSLFDQLGRGDEGA